MQFFLEILDFTTALCFYFILFYFIFLDVLTCALLGDLETVCETYQCVSVGIVFDEMSVLFYAVFFG